MIAGLVSFIGACAPGSARAESASGAGIITALAGHVTVARPAAVPRPVTLRERLYWRDVVEAGKDSVARVLLAGKTTVTMRELSRLELREETQAEGVRYSVELMAGKVRTSVARMLMGSGEQVELRTRNAVASVRGTDFIVETVDRPTSAGAFGLLEASDVALAVADGGSRPSETIVVTLSGLVEVSNRLAGMGHVERVGAYEGVRVSGRQNPARFTITPTELKALLKGLTLRSPREAWIEDESPAIGETADQGATVPSSNSLAALGWSLKIVPLPSALGLMAGAFALSLSLEVGRFLLRRCRSFPAEYK